MLTHYKDVFMNIHRKVRKTFYFPGAKPEHELQYGDMHKNKIVDSIKIEKKEIQEELLWQKRLLQSSKKSDNSEAIKKVTELKSILKYILHFEKFTKYLNGKVINAPNNLLDTSRKKIGYFQSIDDSRNQARPDEELISTNIFLLDGKYWNITYCGEKINLKDKEGMKEVATLLGKPNEDFYPADLFAITSKSETLYDDKLMSVINEYLNDNIEIQSPFDLGASQLSQGDIAGLRTIFEKFRRDKYEERGLDPDRDRDKKIEEDLSLVFSALRQDNPQQKKVRDLMRNRLNRAKEELKVFPALYEHICRCIQAIPKGKKGVVYYRYSPEKQTKWHVQF